MSFLYRTTPLLRTSAIRQSPRLFSTAAVYRAGGITDAVKEPLKKVDRAVSDTIVAGIDKGVEIKDKAAATAGIEASDAKGTAKEVTGQAKGKAAELKGEAIGKKEEVKAKL